MKNNTNTKTRRYEDNNVIKEEKNTIKKILKIDIKKQEIEEYKLLKTDIQ